VLISSIFLVLETFDDKKILEISTILGFVFWGIYLIELLLKAISFGFCLGENTYLTDAWNILDFLIIISGGFSFLPHGENNLYLLRVLKVVRPLKALTAIPNMKGFISSLLLSLMDLLIVFIFFLFFYIFFALIGLSLWSDIFDYHCRTSLLPVNGTLPLDPNFSYLCGGQNLCNGKESMCLSSKDLWEQQLYFFNEKNNLQNFDNELYTEKLNYGYTTFGNFFNSMFIVFQVTTMEGWGNIMYIVMSAHNSVLAAVYFISLIILNNYFMMNLLVAILLFNFEKNFQNTIKEDHFLFNFKLPALLGGGSKKKENEINNNINAENNLKVNQSKTVSNLIDVNNSSNINNNNNNCGGFINNFNSVIAFDGKNLEGNSSLNSKIGCGNELIHIDKCNSIMNLNEEESKNNEKTNNINNNIINNSNNIEENFSYSMSLAINESKIGKNTSITNNNFKISYENKSKKNKGEAEINIKSKLHSDQSHLYLNLAESARIILNQENELISSRENKDKLENKLNKDEFLLEDLKFYSKDELLNAALVRNKDFHHLEKENTRKNSSNYNNNQLDKNLNADDYLRLNIHSISNNCNSDSNFEKDNNKKKQLKSNQEIIGFNLSYLNSYHPILK